MPAVTLFVKSLPTSASNERLEEIFSEIGPVKQCFVVNEKGIKQCRGFGYVTYSMEEDARQAMKQIKEYDGKTISISVAKKKIHEKKKTAPKEQAPKSNEPTFKGIRKSTLKSKLIVRNLSFKCSEEDLKQTFTEFGAVLETKIPLKPDGKMRGFGFVLFKNVSEAGRALKAMNMKDIKGRQVAVDWALAKDKFLAGSQSSSTEAPKETGKPTEDQLHSESDSEEEDGAEKQKAPQKGGLSNKAVQQVKKEEDEDDTEEDSEEEEIDDDVDGEEEEEEDDSVSQQSGDDGYDDDKSDLDDDDDDDDDEDDDDDDDDDDELDSKPRKPLPSDVNQGRTIFIRNLSFDTEEEGLEEALLRYGELKYIKIVLHPDTDHSKGCAFAQFKSKESADKCIAAAQDDAEHGGIRVDGRKLTIVAAVSRENAAKLNDKKVKVETGTRNLYLAREGLIRAGTKAAEGVPEADMIKRTRFEEIKRAKLRDLNVYVSKTRLCVHNLPKSVDDKKLKGICLQAVKGSKAVRITECRVMYDKKPEKGRVMGQSLGYGFVQFQNQDHALSTLRHLNNNPDIFGPNKRPIVEFSLEDGRKLKLKELRQQRNKEQFRNRPGKGVVKFKSQTPGGGAIAKPGGAIAKPGGAIAKPGGSIAKPGGANTKPGGANTKPGGAITMPGGTNTKPSGAIAKPSSEQLKKKIEPSPVQNRPYAGFQTKPEVEYMELEDGKKKRRVLPMPSHRGPKIRLRDKGKAQPPSKKKSKTRPSRREQKGPPIVEKPAWSRTQIVKTGKKPFRKEEDRFDSMVEKYKRKIMGDHKKTTNIKRNKWFS